MAGQPRKPADERAATRRRADHTWWKLLLLIVVAGAVGLVTIRPGPARINVAKPVIVAGGDQPAEQADAPVPLPSPVIEIMDETGMAPFTVHVHGLGTLPEVGDLVTTRLAWDFGDPAGRNNRLVGFNAAHVYEKPGAYTVTLTATNQAGGTASVTVLVTVTPSSRRLVHVSPDGNDRHDGSDPEHAVRTVARAQALLGDDTEIRFRRGGTYEMPPRLAIRHDNVVVGAYGDGADPVLSWTGDAVTYAAIVDLRASASNVLIEDLVFDSPHQPSHKSVRAVAAKGRAVTIRDCRFEKIGTAVMAEGRGAPAGLLTLDNTAAIIGGYFAWGEGTDHCHLGNTVAGSDDQHNMRFAGVERLLIVGNDLTNSPKTCIWYMGGEYARIAGNSLHDGPVRIGPHRSIGPASGRARHIVVDGNRMSGHAFKVFPGAENVLLSNNVVRRDGNHGFEIYGWSEKMKRTSVGVRVVNNTELTQSSTGKFITIHAGARDVLVASNMFVAPGLKGGRGAVNTDVLDGDLGPLRFNSNLWAEAATAGQGVHRLGPDLSRPEAYLTPRQWMAEDHTAGERYRAFRPGDLDDTFAPRFPAATGQAVPGVHTDLHGNPRPVRGAVKVGAVEQGGRATGRPSG